jgi:hypothetical protein
LASRGSFARGLQGASQFAPLPHTGEKRWHEYQCAERNAWSVYSRLKDIQRVRLGPAVVFCLALTRIGSVIGTFLLVTASVIGISYRLPDIYRSYTLILVDPQKVPDAYVKATVTGDVRNRLGTLSQQIVSANASAANH